MPLSGPPDVGKRRQAVRGGARQEVRALVDAGLDVNTRDEFGGTCQFSSGVDNARVVAVWEGIRRTHGAPPEQAAPLMPPELFDVLDACPTTKVWRTPGRPDEQHPQRRHRLRPISLSRIAGTRPSVRARVRSRVSAR